MKCKSLRNLFENYLYNYFDPASEFCFQINGKAYAMMKREILFYDGFDQWEDMERWRLPVEAAK